MAFSSNDGRQNSQRHILTGAVLSDGLPMTTFIALTCQHGRRLCSSVTLSHWLSSIFYAFTTFFFHSSHKRLSWLKCSLLLLYQLLCLAGSSSIEAILLLGQYWWPHAFLFRLVPYQDMDSPRHHHRRVYETEMISWVLSDTTTGPLP